MTPADQLAHLATMQATDIVRAYSGKPGCMCGCRGKYYEPGERGLTHVLHKIQAAVREQPAEIQIDSDLIYVQVNESRCYALYLH
jgi:hypothetical protein